MEVEVGLRASLSRKDVGVAGTLHDDGGKWGVETWARTWRIPARPGESAQPSDGFLPPRQREPGSPVRVEVWRPRRGRAAVLLAALLMAAAALPSVSLLPAARRIPTAIERIGGLVRPLSEPLELPPLQQRSTVYAADGSVLAHVYRGYDRQVVPLRNIPHVTQRAVLAVEDHAFYSHGALDLESIIRAAIVDLQQGRIVQGGSTITQQLVKDVFTGSQVTLGRKLREAEDAIRLARTYRKRRILAAYLNEVFLGRSLYGLAAAAQYYFGERVQDLTLARSALLAGMIAAPNRFDPIDHAARARWRRSYVLGRMRDLGWITRDRFEQAAAAPLGLSDRMRTLTTAGPNSWWTQYVVSEFLSDPRFGPTPRARARLLFQGGLKIHTTLDPRLQRDAERAIRNRMSAEGLPQSALVSIVPSTGAIVAMALGRWGFGSHQYNVAVDPGGGRTAGSSFKVFTLAAALGQGIPPWTVYDGSSPKTIPNCGGGETWTVHNAEPGSGSYPLWLATVDSVNAVFAQVINEVGPEAVARVAHRMGISNPLVAVCPLTLGTSPVSPLQMTSAVSTLANDGMHCDPYAIARVVSPTGRVIFEQHPECTRAIRTDVAEEETAILEDVIGFGTGTAANIGRPAAGKTGTGQDYQDAWFVGYVPQLATGVWVGYANAEIPMPSVPGYGRGFGGVLAAPIWHDFMLLATARMSVEGFAPPPMSLTAPAPSPTLTSSPSPTLLPGPSVTPSP